MKTFITLKSIQMSWASLFKKITASLSTFFFFFPPLKNGIFCYMHFKLPAHIVLFIGLIRECDELNVKVSKYCH